MEGGIEMKLFQHTGMGLACCRLLGPCMARGVLANLLSPISFSNKQRSLLPIILCMGGNISNKLMCKVCSDL